jgi:hypothetical protein
MLRKAFFFLFLVAAGLSSCEDSPKLPKEARVPVPVTIARFDRDFFALDTNRLNEGLNVLSARYPVFFPNYLQAILGIYPADPLAPDAIRAFLNSYRPVYQQALPITEKQLSVLPGQLETALQWMKYLVPSFKPDSPFVVTPFIGPMDAYESFSIGDYGDVRTSNGVGIALQFHLGEEAALYEQGIKNGIFYQYQVRRFTPETMLVNALKNVIEDLYPYTAAGKPMVEEMVEKGKRLYLLKRVLPETGDSLLLGYTGKQTSGCYENEATIWQFFVKNDLLYSIEPAINQQYLRDGPKTPELGDASPGYIGMFTGWRIVEAYMKKFPDTTIDALMKKPAMEVYQASNYRPE